MNFTLFSFTNFVIYEQQNMCLLLINYQLDDNDEFMTEVI